MDVLDRTIAITVATAETAVTADGEISGLLDLTRIAIEKLKVKFVICWH